MCRCSVCCCLEHVGLDDFTPPKVIVEGHADSLDVWRVIVARMVQAEVL